MTYWLGCDPGGKDKFGVAKLYPSGEFHAQCVSSVDEALQLADEYPLGVGIDCPLWWSAGVGGGRKADSWIRKNYGLSGGQVQSVNSLQGAAVVQGILLSMKMREKYPTVKITEAHPKALLKALKIEESENFKTRFELSGQLSTEDERDALIAAVAAREGYCGRWTIDLSLQIGQQEIEPQKLWFGSVNYWWPDIG
jgi:predicted nuclease with RNAse H fold